MNTDLDPVVRDPAAPDLIRHIYFAPGTPQSVLDRTAQRLQPESSRALNIDMTVPLPKVDTAATEATILVIGAEHDSSITRREIRATAAPYRGHYRNCAGYRPPNDAGRQSADSCQPHRYLAGRCPA